MTEMHTLYKKAPASLPAMCEVQNIVHEVFQLLSDKMESIPKDHKDRKWMRKVLRSLKIPLGLTYNHLFYTVEQEREKQMTPKMKQHRDFLDKFHALYDQNPEWVKIIMEVRDSGLMDAKTPEKQA